MKFSEGFCIFIVKYLLTPNVINAQETCGESKQFLCSSGECISKEYLCDGSKECSDGSDETHNLCQFRPCSQSLDYIDQNPSDIFSITSLGQGQSFRCGYGACISFHFVCDGIRHCIADGSDEAQELCEDRVCDSQQFKCAYGACVPRRNACDNRYQCFDGSDETEEACEWRNSMCPRRRFKCTYGACIDKGKRCDAVIDCLDESDESEETCGPRPNLLLRSAIPLPPNYLNRLATPQTTVAIPTERPVHVSKPTITDDNKKENRSGCKQTDDSDVTLEILTCGDESDCDGPVLPVGTEMLIVCDDIPIPLQCRDDLLWHFLRDTLKTPREMPCAESGSSSSSSLTNDNPSVQPMPASCGIIPFLSPIPWLIGLFRRGEFSCTGTVIGPSLILTAGHCVIRNQASNRRTIEPNELKVQVNSPNPNDPNQFASVSLIKLHPHYIGGQTPRSDIALIFLKENLESMYGLSSACLDKDGKLLNIPAYTFNRTVGQAFYRWSPFSQNLDTSCVNKATICSRHLNIGYNQFCATNKGSRLYLHQGSSGGPYMISINENGEAKWTVAGIVSNSIYTSDCGIPHTVFTSVSKYYKWIINCGFYGDCSA